MPILYRANQGDDSEMANKCRADIVSKGCIPIGELTRFKGLVIYGKLKITGEWDNYCYVIDGEKIFKKGDLKTWLDEEPIIFNRDSERLRIQKRYHYLERVLPKLQKEFEKLKEEI